jgi:hypothetical protein
MSLADQGMGKTLRRATLINPFEVSQDRPQIVERKASQTSRSTPVCSSCSSDDIIAHATVQWSNEAQEWQLASTFGQPAHCNSCDSSCSLVWLTLN